MTIWLVTIGSSDIELTEDGHSSDHAWNKQTDWLTGDYERRDQFSKSTSKFVEPQPAQSGNTDNRSVLMRVLGIIYQNLDKVYDDSSSIKDKAPTYLKFPLLDEFIEILKNEKDLRVFVLLTDQSTLFSDPSEVREPECPYWQDTKELKPILEWYFEDKLGVVPQFITLEPWAEEEGAKKKGIDCWSEMLCEVRKQLNEAAKDLQLVADPEEKVYVSHQAGTPAISSALQFCSIAKFGDRVQFLVLNREYEDQESISKTELVESSEYIRAIKIEKAKQLIDQGEPGAALALLDEKESKANDKLRSVINRLQDLVNLFNAKAIDNPNDDELDIKNAAARIKNTLDIVGLLFKNEKYVLGIAILESAHETFVKASVIHTWENIKKESSHKFPISFGQDKEGKNIKLNKRTEIQISDELSWKDEGVMWYQGVDKSGEKQGEILHNRFQTYSIFKALECAEKLDFWLVFQVIFKEAPNPQSKEIRNQFMHNLRGITKEDVILYLSGQPEKNRDDSIRSIYQEKVVIPFHQALKDIGLWEAANLDDRPSIQDRLDELIKDLDKLA
jgi:hypothetical protein